MANETAEMINNAAEEIKETPVKEMVENVIQYIRVVENPTSIALKITCCAVGIASYEAVKWIVKKTVRFGEKKANDFKDKRNAKKAAKAKPVEGTDCTVEES